MAEGGQLNDFAIGDLFENGTPRAFPKKQIVIYEGEPVKRLYYVESGYIKVYNILSNGTERTIFFYGPGDAFPLTSHLSGAGAVRYFYECLTPVKLKYTAPEDFDAQLKNNFEAGEALIRYTSEVNDRFAERIDVLSVNDARRKITAMLSILVAKAGTGSPISQLAFNLTHQDIADMCGLTRETTSMQLLRLKKEGVLDSTKNFLINAERLAKLKNELSIPI